MQRLLEIGNRGAADPAVPLGIRLQNVGLFLRDATPARLFEALGLDLPGQEALGGLCAGIDHIGLVERKLDLNGIRAALRNAGFGAEQRMFPSRILARELVGPGDSAGGMNVIAARNGSVPKLRVEVFQLEAVDESRQRSGSLHVALQLKAPSAFFEASRLLEQKGFHPPEFMAGGPIDNPEEGIQAFYLDGAHGGRPLRLELIVRNNNQPEECAVAAPNREKHWNQIAADWDLWGAPLRPCSWDTDTMSALLKRYVLRGEEDPLRALMWGVTPEIAEMAWPERTELTAVDRAPEMIEGVWPGDQPGRRRAVVGSWLDFPREDGQFDVIVGDGVCNLFPFPVGYEELAAKAQRVLAKDGLLTLRFFVRSGERASVAKVLENLRAGRTGNFHIFKFRLAMALQEDAATGVRMGDVHSAWLATGISPEELAAETGWRLGEIRTIDHYAGKDAALTFPSWAEIAQLFERRFELMECIEPQYEMGECCPIAVFRRRA